jgi:hypothetical protein
MMPITVDDAPSDLAKSTIGAPIITWNATALNRLNQCELNAPLGYGESTVGLNHGEPRGHSDY